MHSFKLYTFPKCLDPILPTPYSKAWLNYTIQGIGGPIFKNWLLHQELKLNQWCPQSQLQWGYRKKLEGKCGNTLEFK
jgi:hypothetical protein